MYISYSNNREIHNQGANRFRDWERLVPPTRCFLTESSYSKGAERVEGQTQPLGTFWSKFMFCLSRWRPHGLPNSQIP